jgi:transglutaminase-like putative cysteine protease
MDHLTLERLDRAEYLKPSAFIDFHQEQVAAAAERLAGASPDEIAKVRAAYEFVRDRIRHSFDCDAATVTCSASAVLREGHGICYAKAHLLAALLRWMGIPTGFCYQRLLLFDDDPRIVLHGLNAVYLSSLGRWIRLDARGNKTGINAQFAVEKEQLAFPVHPESGESDNRVVYAEPNPKTIAALQRSHNLTELLQNLPGEI